MNENSKFRLTCQNMPPFQKYGLILLACFVCVIVLADFLASWKLNIRETITFHSYLPYFTSSNFSMPLLSHRPLQSSYFEVRNISSASHKSFFETFQDFPWAEFEEAAAKNDSIKKLEYSKSFVDKLTYYLQLEPLIPINENCKAPELPLPSEIDCTKYPKAFTGIKRNNTVKIGVLLQLGFDIDILEIHFQELHDAVDMFFVIESTHAHYGNLRKPLMWERVQQQERFKHFPVVHFIVDDAEGSRATDKMWQMESLQERRRWEKFIEWNDATKFFNDDDIVGFGDVDEIPSRANVHLLKYCEFSNSIDFGIWFPYGHINQAFITDFPIHGHPLTLGDPTYFKLSSAKSKTFSKNPNEFPTRRRGGSPNYLLGGIHMTHYGYLPFQLVKHATATEGGLRSKQTVQEISSLFKLNDTKRMETYFAETPKHFNRRIKQVNLADPEMRQICILPWFYDCNRKRYPVWEDGHDTRLD